VVGTQISQKVLTCAPLARRVEGIFGQGNLLPIGRCPGIFGEA
jgi:hypothetical protein